MESTVTESSWVIATWIKETHRKWRDLFSSAAATIPGIATTLSADSDG